MGGCDPLPQLHYRYVHWGVTHYPYYIIGMYIEGVTHYPNYIIGMYIEGVTHYPNYIIGMYIGVWPITPTTL